MASVELHFFEPYLVCGALVGFDLVAAVHGHSGDCEHDHAYRGCDGCIVISFDFHWKKELNHAPQTRRGEAPELSEQLGC